MIPRFSPKQQRVLRWWGAASPDRGKDAIICDGAVRSGKTLCLGLSFVLWATARFRGQQFALCGKTTESVRRNLLTSVLPVLEELGFTWEEKVSRNKLLLRLGGRENTFYLFGGKDESSAGLIQGVTLAGDEASFTVPAGGETVLSVQVKLGEDGPEIRQWKTVYNGDWQAEDSLDLWDASDVAAP